MNLEEQTEYITNIDIPTLLLESLTHAPRGPSEHCLACETDTLPIYTTPQAILEDIPGVPENSDNNTCILHVPLPHHADYIRRFIASYLYDLHIHYTSTLSLPLQQRPADDMLRAMVSDVKRSCFHELETGQTFEIDVFSEYGRIRRVF
ncbi:hypothetical protein H0G86_001185 [Trichoderma simmonsii]|uniref:Uncharacterized protein n=1 Tax=Trichoderma simmonsii TaxID=1491479 RepID=A0A8G0L136_9HYPO|nr:hypothetical protein H0G86_001185 [Trichoderma simmonsii]